jgi:signal transduction histidine kinase
MAQLSYHNASLKQSIKPSYFFNYTMLEIADNGIGIDTETNKNYIFGMYKRINSEIEGKGVGLFITKAQIESMGGRIDVEGEKGVGFVCSKFIC